MCSDEFRKKEKLICVIEGFNDYMAIENSGQFEGQYHCLGGVLNPLLGVGPDDLEIESLVRRVKEEKIENIILAINPSLEGQATCAYLNEILSDHSKVERIGFGMPIGGSLEFLDAQTISTAIANKKEM